MNKVTLSVAALAAIGAPVSIQAAETTADRALISEYNEYIQSVIKLVKTYDQVIQDQYLADIEALLVSVDKDGLPTGAYPTVEGLEANKLKAQILVDQAAKAQLPYTYKNNLTTELNKATAKYATHYSKLTSANFVGEGSDKFIAEYQGKLNAIKKELDAIDSTIKDYDMAGQAIINEYADNMSNILGLSAQLDSYEVTKLQGIFLANTNETAYAAVKKIIDDDVTPLIETAFQDILNLFEGQSKYDDWYSEAYSKLAALKARVAKVNQLNEDANKAGEAHLKKQLNLDELNEIVDAVPAIATTYGVKKNNQDTAYKTLDGNVNVYISGSEGLQTLRNKLNAKAINNTSMNADLDAAIAQFKAFKTKVSNNYDAHTVYENQKALQAELDKLASSTKYSDLKEKAKQLVSNGEEYNKVINSLDKANTGLVAKLNSAVTNASKASSLDSSYNPAAHYTDVKAEIDNAIAKIRTEALNELNNSNKAVRAFSYDGDNAKRNAVDTQITNYTNNTGAALGAFNQAKSKYNKAAELLAKLDTTATNPEVTIDGLVGNATSITYRQYMDNIKAQLKSLDDAIAAANSKVKGAEHLAAMQAAVTNSTNINTTEIEGKIEGYSINEGLWAQNKLYAEAESLLKVTSDSLTSFGKRTRDVVGTTPWDAQQTYGKNKLTTAIVELGDKIEKAILDLRDGDLAGTFHGVSNYYMQYNAAKAAVDPDDPTTLTALSDLSKVIIEYKAKWQKTISAIEADVKTLESKKQPALDNKAKYDALSPLVAEVTAAITAAEDDLKNIVYKDEDYSNDNGYKYFAGLLSDYNDKAKTEEDLVGYTAAIAKAYNEGTLVSVDASKNFENKLNTLKANVAAVTANAIKNKNEYKNQLTTYQGTDGKGGVKKTLADVKAVVLSDQTSAAASLLKRVAEQQTALDALLTLIESKYAKGDSYNDSDVQAKFDAINAELASIKADQANWESVLVKDNLAEHNKFLNQHFDVAKQSYYSAVTILNEFSLIKNQAITTAMAELVDTHKAIYDKIDELLKVRDDEQQAYNANLALSTPTIYAATEYIKKVDAYQAEIETLIQNYCDKVNTVAFNTYKALLKNDLDAVNAAQTYVGTKYADGAFDSDNVKKNAFTSIVTLVNNAISASGISGKDLTTSSSFTGTKDNREFAYVLDHSLSQLEKAAFDATLDEAKKKAAKDEFEYSYNLAFTTYEKELSEIQAATDVPTADLINTLTKTSKPDIIDWANNEYNKKLKTNPSGEELMNYVGGTIVPKLSTYYTNYRAVDAKNNPVAWKSASYKELQTRKANLGLYDEIAGIIAAGQDKLEEAKVWANTLFATHVEINGFNDAVDIDGNGKNDVVEKIDDVQVALDRLTDRNILSGSSLAPVKTDADNYVNAKDKNINIDKDIAALKTKAISCEIAALEIEVQRVKELYNNAVKESDFDFDADKAYANAIEKIIFALTNDDAKKGNLGYNVTWKDGNGTLTLDSAYAALTDIEKQIANLSKAINDVYAPNAQADALTALNALSKDVAAKVDGVRTKATAFDDIKNVYEAKVVAIEKLLDNINKDVEAKNTDNTLLFYNQNLKNDYNDVDSLCQQLLDKGGLQANYDKYNTNKNNYNTIVAELDVILENYASVKELVYGFEFEEKVYSKYPVLGVIPSIDWRDAQTKEGIDETIAAYKQEYEKQYANIAVNDNSKNGLTSTTVNDGNGVSYKKSIQDAITTFERNAKYKEADQTYSAKLLTAIQNVYKVVSGRVPTNAKFNPDNNGSGTFDKSYDSRYWKDKLTYSEETSKMLGAQAEELLNAYAYVREFNRASCTSDKVYYDETGKFIAKNTNPDLTQTPRWAPIDNKYLAAGKGWDAVVARINELISDSETLLNECKNDYAYVLGDIDQNGEVNVNDYVELRSWIVNGKELADIELESKRYAGDVDQDGEYTVADLTQVSKNIFNGTSFTKAANASARAAALGQNVEIDMNVTMESEETTLFGKTLRLAVNVASSQAFSAGQMDITLPAGLTLSKATLSDRANGHELAANKLANGAIRLVAETIENAEFIGNAGALIYLDVEVGSDFNGGDINVNNIIFSDTDARVYRAAINGPLTPTGIDGVEAATMKERIYSVGGQMMKAVKKGLNIIVGEGNNSKKVIK